MKKTLISGGSVVTSKGSSIVDVLIDVTGTIVEMRHGIEVHKDVEKIDAKEKILLPLLIDCHVHFREPGLEHKATMETEGLSALAGGVGTVCEMPNTIPPTVTVAALADKVRRSEAVDGLTMKFFFGVTEAIHLAALRELWTGSSLELRRLRHHCAGVKLYLDHSTGDQKVDGGIVPEIFKTCAELKIPLVAHCEDSNMNAEAGLLFGKEHGDVSLHSSMRPAKSEGKAIEEAIALVRTYKTPFHVAHLSTKLGVDLVRKAKAEKLPVTCEVAPHHLFLTTDDYATLGTQAKMNPPLRSLSDRDALWQGIADGTIDCIATDHAPHTLEEKMSGEPLRAPSGVPGVETMLPLLLTVASGAWPHPRGGRAHATGQLTHEDILRLCFTNPNRMFSLGQEEICVGSKARICLIDPQKNWTIEGKNLHSKCAWTPYEGWRVTGKVERTLNEG